MVKATIKQIFSACDIALRCGTHGYSSLLLESATLVVFRCSVSARAERGVGERRDSTDVGFCVPPYSG